MFKAGDSVVVKPGIVDPDFSIEIGGWQGRILGIGPDREDTVLICWDSITLKNMPGSVIEQSEEQGLDWTKMYLEAQEVELTSPRDTEDDVVRAINELSKKYAWSYLGEEGKRIGKVLAGVDEDNEMGALDAWEEHLRKSLVFPFEAEVAEYQDRGPLQAGDRVKVTNISLVDDLYGIIVDLRRGRRKYAFPLWIWRLWTRIHQTIRLWKITLFGLQTASEQAELIQHDWGGTLALAGSDIISHKLTASEAIQAKGLTQHIAAHLEVGALSSD